MNIPNPNHEISKNGLLVVFFVSLFSVYSNAQTFEEILKIPWNTNQGIATEKYPEANYGIADFAIIDDNAIALLCNSENRIKTYKTNSQSLISEFKSQYDDEFLEYGEENKLFYVSNPKEVRVYKTNGILDNETQFDYPNIVISNLLYANNNLYLNASGQKYYTIIRNGFILKETDQNVTKSSGKVLAENIIAENVGKVEDGKVTIRLKRNNNSLYYSVQAGEKSHGMNPISIWENFLILEEYFHKGESYGNIYKRLLFYSLDSKQVITKVEIPNIRFTSHQNDFKLSGNSLYNLLTTPDYAYVLKLDLTLLKFSENMTLGYPTDFDFEYHYNTGYK